MRKEKEIRLEDLQPDDRAEFMRIVARDPAIMAMEQKAARLQQRGKYIEALQVRQKITECKQRAFALFVAKLNAYVERVDIFGLLDDTQRRELNVLLIAFFMACEIIDSAVVDIKSKVKGVDPTLEFFMFDDIKQVITQARDKIQLLNRLGDFSKNVVWDDTLDNMYGMMKNKARSILRKREAAGDRWRDDWDRKEADNAGTPNT